jgi:hypothetical protein
MDFAKAAILRQGGQIATDGFARGGQGRGEELHRNAAAFFDIVDNEVLASRRTQSLAFFS